MFVWPQKGPSNTDNTIASVFQYIKEQPVQHLVVASNSGATVKKFLDSGLKLICVTHQIGFIKPGEDEMGEALRHELQAKGVQILTTTHLFSGIDRSLRFKFQGVYPAEIVASTLRMFGQGVKVGVEIACMALDAGLIPYGQEVVTVAGSGSGADTALVILPAHSQNFFDTQIKDIICIPREK